jgi:large subunit ribosomal protein L9
MQIILLEKVKNLGELGDTVVVKPGFARNYLFPQGKAVAATEVNQRNFEQTRAELEEKNQQVLAKAKERALLFQGVQVTVTAMASDEGRLYGSVGIAEIKEALEKQSLEVSKKEISLKEGSIHVVGEYVAELHMHSDVTVEISVQVVPAK